jgi:hypothetical protein
MTTNDMQLSQRSQDWLRWTLVTSVPLRHLDEGGKPIGIASGCLVACAGRKFIMSACHAVQPESKGWAIELSFDSEKGTEMYWPRNFSYMAEMQKGSGVLDHVDFCFAEVAMDVESTYAHRTPYSVSDVRARHIFGIEDFIEPSQTGIFAFAGEVKPEMHGPDAFVTEMNVYPGLRFVRSEGAYHVFKLPVAHPGHDSFRGCSGAPIVDMEGRVVALVTTGDQVTGTIRGVAISRAVTALTWYCNAHDQSSKEWRQ